MDTQPILYTVVVATVDHISYLRCSRRSLTFETPRGVEEVRKVGVRIVEHSTHVHIEQFGGEDGGLVGRRDGLADGVELSRIGHEFL